ncbi:uncharacterized protein LOC134823533 [Bolinopsis microptera]|uniref:uncharacterized protein LOC134823533 n=1 Tax=Bolinopsis microptera TaxID=2820187 RepID=UPI00307B0D2E
MELHNQADCWESGRDDLAIARVRHQASLVVMKGGNYNLAVTMALKAAVSWARAGEIVEGYQILKEVEENIPTERTLEFLSIKAQLACFEGDLEKAEKLLHSISEQSKEIASATCWEIAINFYKEEKLTNTRYAVERAIKFGKGILPNVKLSRMYRLLTTCCFEEGADVSTCITAARLATQLDPCAESQLLLVKCLAVTDNGDMLVQQLEEIKSNLPDWLSEALDIVLEYGKPVTTGEILSRYNNFTSCNTQLLLLKSQLSPDNMESIERVSKTLELLKNTSSGTEDTDLRIKARDLLWKAGVNMWEKSEFSISEQLYTLCLDLSDTTDRMKLLRNIATCQMALGNVTGAETTLSLANSGDPNETVLHFQLALLKGEESKALELISSIKEEKLLQTAAMLAFKTNQETVAKESLRKAVLASNDPLFNLPAIRCLLRLSKTPEEDLKLFELVEKMQADHVSESELAYLADTAWNCSLKAKQNYEIMKKLLEQCTRLVTRMKTPLTPQYYQRIRNCYLLMTAACLQLADQTDNQITVSEHLHSAMGHISQFKLLGNDNLDQTTTLMLLLYELECAVKLEVPEAGELVKCVSTVPYTTTRTLDRVVRICSLSTDHALSHTAIRYAIEKHLQESEPNWNTISQLFIRLSKHTPDFTQVFKLWSQYASKFPEDEAAWMVCEAWNRGVSRDDLLSRDDVTRELCQLALEVTQLLPSYRDVYQQHMRPIIEQRVTKGSMRS